MVLVPFGVYFLGVAEEFYCWVFICVHGVLDRSSSVKTLLKCAFMSSALVFGSIWLTLVFKDLDPGTIASFAVDERNQFLGILSLVTRSLT